MTDNETADELNLDRKRLISELSNVFGGVEPTRIALVGSFSNPDKLIDKDGESDVDICWTSEKPRASGSFTDSIPVWSEDGTYLGKRELELFRPREMDENDVQSFEDALDYFPEARELNWED